MSGCELGVFEYEFVYIQWVATSLGGVVGILGGLFVGIILLGVAVVVHQLHLAKKQRSSSLKDQLIALCTCGREERDDVSEVFSYSAGDNFRDWPNFHIPCQWDDIVVCTDENVTPVSDGAAMVGIADSVPSAQTRFVMPCFPASLTELLASVNHSTSSADLAALQSTDALDANVRLLAVLCEGFFLLKDTQLQVGAQSSGSLLEAVQEVEEAAVALRKATRTRDNLLGATTHEGLDKKMEALLQWEKEWLLLAFNMVSALYKGVCLLDDIGEREECDSGPGYKTLWSQFQIESVQQVELRMNQWLPAWQHAKEEAVQTVLSSQASLQRMMRSAIDRVLDQVQKNVNGADLPETAKEQILSHASSHLEELRVKASKTGPSLSVVTGAHWSGGNLDSQRKELRKLCKQVTVPVDKTLSVYLMRVGAEWETEGEDRLRELNNLLQDTLSNQQAWYSGLLEELSGFCWLLGDKEHQHLLGLKQTVMGACQEHLTDCRAQLETWVDSHQTEVTGTTMDQQYFQATSTSSAGNGSFVSGGTESLSDSLPGLHSAIQSSVAVVSRMVEGMKPNLRMHSEHLLTQHSANAAFLHFQLTCSLERLTKCAKWLLAHLWAGKKEKHHRKTSPKEGEEDARNKQIKTVMESFQSLLEKQGIDFTKTQEEDLEKEFEEMRQKAEKETHLEEKEQEALAAVKNHMMLKAAETSGMMHLVSERILQEHQTAVRKIQEDMERTKQHQLMIMQQKLQARKLLHERMVAQTTEDLKVISPNSAVAQALLQLLMDVRQRRAEKEFKRELEEEHKRELALLEAKLSQQMKHKLKAQEVRIIQTMARTCKLSDEQLAAEISSATAGMGDISEQIVHEMAKTEAHT